MSDLIDDVELELISEIILDIRGQRLILDRDLAALYGVTTKAFNQAVKRNEARFPADFRVRLTKSEKSELVTKCDRFEALKHSSVLPYAFTEHGALMAANILKSEKAHEMSIYVIRAFVHLRKALLSKRRLATQMAEVEKRLDSHDENLEALTRAIENLLEQPEEKESKRKIGFNIDDE